MITLDDFKKVIFRMSFEDFHYDYQDRQTENAKNNNSILLDVINSLKIPNGDILDTDHIFHLLTEEYKKHGNDEKIKGSYEVLKKHGYNTLQELVYAMTLTDQFFTNDMREKDYQRYINSLSLVNGFNSIMAHNVELNSQQGNITLKEVPEFLGTSEISPDERRGNCHELTSNVLKSQRDFNLLGAYYYIPQSFQGALEHSVLLDPDNNMVYDVAQNIAVPLSIWEQFYTPAFTISRQEFIDLERPIEDLYGYKINMMDIEQVRRRTK